MKDNKSVPFQPTIEEKKRAEEITPQQKADDSIYDILYEAPETKERNNGDGSSIGASKSRPTSIVSFYASTLLRGGDEEAVNE